MSFNFCATTAPKLLNRSSSPKVLQDIIEERKRLPPASAVSSPRQRKQTDDRNLADSDTRSYELRRRDIIVVDQSALTCSLSIDKAQTQDKKTTNFSLIYHGYSPLKTMGYQGFS